MGETLRECLAYWVAQLDKSILIGYDILLTMIWYYLLRQMNKPLDRYLLN